MATHIFTPDDDTNFGAPPGTSSVSKIFNNSTVAAGVDAASFSGTITGGAVSGTTGTFTGAVSGTTGTFSGAVAGTTGTFSGAVAGTTGTFSSAVAGTTGTFSGGVSGTTGTFSDTITRSAGNGANWQFGSISEEITIAAAASTDSTANLLPANSIIEAVVLRVTTVIPTAATFTIGDATTAARFGTGIAVAAGTTNIGIIQHNTGNADAAGPVQTAAAKIRITPNAQPAAATGTVRVTVFYRTFVAPTS